MIDSPKKQFLKSKSAETVAEILTNPNVLAALDCAMLQFVWEARAGEGQEMASAYHNQMIGAKVFKNMFLTIATPEKPIAKPRLDNLPYEA